MPELAETFIIARQVAQAFDVPFKTDADLILEDTRWVPKSYNSRKLKVVWTDKVYEHLKDFEFELKSISHRGKKMWMSGTKMELLEISLGMTGRFSIHPTDHDRITFSGNEPFDIFYYSDIRKFGTIRKMANDWSSLVKPSLSGDASKRAQWVHEALQMKPNWTIKERLVDQQGAISGIGNYMANEILFASKINPLVKVSEITEEDTANILTNGRIIAHRSVYFGGCTLRDFKDIIGRKGLFQDYLRIHQVDICHICQAAVTKIGSPPTYFCPVCQPVKN